MRAAYKRPECLGQVSWTRIARRESFLFFAGAFPVYKAVCEISHRTAHMDGNCSVDALSHVLWRWWPQGLYDTLIHHPRAALSANVGGPGSAVS